MRKLFIINFSPLNGLQVVADLNPVAPDYE
jgi:hypothetical protein